jgi:hypothetical protein
MKRVERFAPHPISEIKMAAGILKEQNSPDLPKQIPHE